MSFCNCSLHAASIEECSGLRPEWLRQYTGTGGALHFRLQDWAWGNTMMALRDSLAIAIVLNRRPVLLVGPGQPPLNGAELSSVFDLHAITVVTESKEARRNLRTPAGMAALGTAADVRAELARPSPPSQDLYTRLLTSFMDQQQRQLRQLAHEYSGRAAWPSLFTAPVPDCWASAFLRPAARVRAAALPLVAGTSASAHIRLCSLVSWRDTCKPLSQPHAIARSILGCAARTQPAAAAARLFVASDSAPVLDALRRDSRAGNLSLAAPATPHALPAVVSTAPPRLGAASHLSRLGASLRAGGKHELGAQASLDRAVFDWAAFAYSKRVHALPSSFSASAVCMFAPATATFVVHQRPAEAAADVDCERPLASSAGGGPHPCNDLLRVNWGGTGSKGVPGAKASGRRPPRAKAGGREAQLRRLKNKWLSKVGL